jgi:hypothetical protein
MQITNVSRLTYALDITDSTLTRNTLNAENTRFHVWSSETRLEICDCADIDSYIEKTNADTAFSILSFSNAKSGLGRDQNGIVSQRVRKIPHHTFNET